jgi:hypothetical protein
LHHKTNGGRTARDTRQNLAACFAWKQVTLGFPSLASRLTEVRWWVVHVASLRRSCVVQVKDGRIDATSCVRPCYSYFIMFYVLDPRGIVVFCFGPINMTLYGCGSLPLLHFSYVFSRLGLVCQEQIFISNSNEGERAVTSMVDCKPCLVVME